MAKINFSSLFQTPLHPYKHFFVFGSESSLFERAISFLQKRLGASLEVKTEADLLGPLASQLSLFGNTDRLPLICVPNATDKSLTFLSTLPAGNFVFTSEKARAQSKLTTYFSTSPSSLAIAAYPSPLTMTELDFMAEGLTLPSDFKNQLMKTYINDRLGLLSALEKVKLVGDIKEPQYELFLQTDPLLGGFTPLRNAILLKDKPQIIDLFFHISSADLIPFLRILTRSFLTLSEISCWRFIPWKNLTVPVFFKEQPLFEAAKPRWSFEEISLFLQTLLFLESKIKSASFSTSHVCHILVEKMFHVKQEDVNSKFSAP
jgi:DNA polymerase III delta subunit